MNPLTALIIDDELHCLETLRWQLTRYCPNVQVLGSHLSAGEALTALRQHTPQVVFLDIEMPRMNAFDLLNALDPVPFHVIFTTAYDEYAVKAFKVNAIDYLLKPIDKDELVVAVQKANTLSVNPAGYRTLINWFASQDPLDGKVPFSTAEGLEMVDVSTIIRCQSDSNYCDIIRQKPPPLTVSRTLKEVEEMLSTYTFFRVHHSHLINLKHVQKYIRGDGGQLVMSDGSRVSVARSRKDQLLRVLTKFLER